MIDYIKQFIVGNNEKEINEFCEFLKEKIKELEPGNFLNCYTDYRSGGKLCELIESYNTVKGTQVYIHVGINKCGITIKRLSENQVKVSIKRGYGLNWEDTLSQFMIN